MLQLWTKTRYNQKRVGTAHNSNIARKPWMHRTSLYVPKLRMNCEVWDDAAYI